MGFSLNPISDLNTLGSDLENIMVSGAKQDLGLAPPNNKLLQAPGYGDKPKAAPKKKAEKKKAAPALTQAEMTKAIENELTSGPWAQLSKALVTQYDQALAPVEAAVSGSTGAKGEADAANQALASLGLSSGSSAGSWLGSQLGAANANAAPVEAAMGAYGQQYAAEAGPISKALAAYGQANELSVAYAPETAWLNALASHITSNLSYGGDVPVSAIGSSITGPVAQAFQQAGGYGAAGQIGGGVAPISDIGVKNGQAYLPKAAGGLGSAAAALTGGGTIPGASTAPQG